MPRRAPHGELAVSLGCCDELVFAPLNTSPCPGAPPAFSPSAAPCRAFITADDSLTQKWRLHGLEHCSGRPLKPGRTRESRQLAHDVAHRLEGDLGNALRREPVKAAPGARLA